jgi:(5-formylfuran-3-yl)methyl phosphate synthase
MCEMRLLVSVANTEDAAAAVAGGADIIDAKDPTTGALGAVSLSMFAEIRATVAGLRPISAALGDAGDEAGVERIVRDYAVAGASFVKIGFDGVSSRTRVSVLITAAMHGAADHTGVVAVAYADADRAAGLDARVIVDAAAHAGAAGVLLDTADKHGPGLRALMTPAALACWVAVAHDAGLRVALAGQLTLDDLDYVKDAGADIVGVRGAACEGGRRGRVTADKVRLLQLAVRRSGPAPAPDPVAACG